MIIIVINLFFRLALTFYASVRPREKLTLMFCFFFFFFWEDTANSLYFSVFTPLAPLFVWIKQMFFGLCLYAVVSVFVSTYPIIRLSSSKWSGFRKTHKPTGENETKGNKNGNRKKLLKETHKNGLKFKFTSQARQHQHLS